MTFIDCGPRELESARVTNNEKLIGKRVQFDSEDWAAISMLAKDRVATFQELADEAFRDLLKKHNRPVGLKASLRQSLGGGAPLDHGVAGPG